MPKQPILSFPSSFLQYVPSQHSSLVLPTQYSSQYSSRVCFLLPNTPSHSTLRTYSCKIKKFPLIRTVVFYHHIKYLRTIQLELDDLHLLLFLCHFILWTRDTLPVSLVVYDLKTVRPCIYIHKSTSQTIQR